MVGGALAVLVLAAGFTAVMAGGVAAQESGAEEVHDEELFRTQLQERDQLILSQEALLNVYRCMFDIDTLFVPGGCFNGYPFRGSSRILIFFGTPTQGDIALRDELIANQEALLNVYRCLFGVDIQVVPGGCAVTSEPAVDPELASFEPATIDVPVYYCGPADSGFTLDKLQAEIDLFNANIHDFFLQESSNMVSLNFVSAAIVSPNVTWDEVAIRDWYEIEGTNPCVDAVDAVAPPQDQRPLILAGISPEISFEGGIVGFAALGRWAIVPIFDNFLYIDRGVYLSIIAHELGHSLFQLGHDHQYNSIMRLENPLDLSEGVISCRHQHQLGWPRHEFCNVPG